MKLFQLSLVLKLVEVGQKALKKTKGGNKMKLNIKYVTGEWVKFKDNASVKIKMLPMSMSFSMSEEDNSPENMHSVFDECVIDWKGFVDENDDEIKCTDKNKQMMFDAYMDLVGFVIEEQNKLRESFSASLKNSKTTASGDLKRTKRTK